MDIQLLWGKTKDFLLLHKELIGVTSGVATLIIGVPTTLTAVGGYRLMSSQNDISRADQLPVIKYVEERRTVSRIPFPFFSEIKIYNLGAPVKDMDIPISTKAFVTFNRKDYGGNYQPARVVRFDLIDYSNGVHYKNDESNFIAYVDANKGIETLLKLRERLLVYGKKSMEFSYVLIQPEYCINVRYTDKFDQSHSEQKCSSADVNNRLYNGSGLLEFRPSGDAALALHEQDPRKVYRAYLRDIIGPQIILAERGRTESVPLHYSGPFDLKLETDKRGGIVLRRVEHGGN